MNIKLPLTKKQNEVYKKLMRFISKNGYSPTVRELQKEIKASSQSIVFEYLERLQSKGWISKERYSQRSIKIK